MIFYITYPNFIDLEEDIACYLIILKKISEVWIKFLHDNHFTANIENKMPHLYLNNYWSFNKEEMLWQLVSTKRRKNPEALEETREFIQQHKLEDKFNFWFHTTNDP